MTQWMYRFLLLLSLLISGLQAAGDDEEDEPEYQRFRFRYFTQHTKRVGTAPTTDDADHGHSSLSESEFKERQEAVRKMWRKRRERGGEITKADVVELYATAKDFKVVHSLLGNEITIAESKAVGRLRQEIHNEVLDSLFHSKRFGSRMGVNDFGSGADMSKVDAKTDIDFTLYGEDQSVTGKTLVAAYIEAFRKITGQYKQPIDPGQCDIVGHQYEATIPDWRRASALSDFEVRLRTGRSLLKANPEAYFLEGAYLQQVMGRSVDPGAKTFLWYEEGADGSLQKRQVNAAKVPKFFYHPQFAARYAWGGSVGNWHFFNAHGDDKPAQGKYLLRSIDNGPGLLLKGKTAEFEKMKPKDRHRLIKRLYGSKFDAATVERFIAVMDTAVRMRELKSAKTLDMGTEAGRANAYGPLIQQLRAEYGVAATDAEFLKMAEDVFVKDGNRLLVQNNIDTAAARLSDWLAPPLKVGKSLDWVDESGNPKKISIDDGLVKRLQYSAFFELRDGIELMPKKMIDDIKAANPRFARDIAILEGVVEKQKQMMNAPETLRPAEAQTWREQMATEIRQEIDGLKQHFQSKGYTSGLWQTGQVLWARGNQLETWLKQATIRRVAQTVGGKKYALHLDRLYQRVDASNQRFLGPHWMARMDKGTSVIIVLKTWVEEGEVNDQVLKVAAYEGLSYVPGVSLLYAIQGGLQGVTTLTFATVIPGYGQMLLVCNFAKGAVELAGAVIFEPLKRDKVLLAYQGYLEPEAGGLIHAGQKERVESPRPPLLLPVDADGDLPLERRREKLYDYFHDSIVATMKQLPSVWYEEHEMPVEWREKEFEILRVRVRQYVNEWWTGTGRFDGYDVLTVHRGEDIRSELEEQLIRDYIKGKNISLQKMMEEREVKEASIQEQYAAIAGHDLAMNDEYHRQRSQYRQNAEVLEAYCLDEMPSIEPSLEIIAAPRIISEKVLGTEDKEEDLIEQIQLRARVNASRKDHPGPWRIEWELRPNGGDTIQFKGVKREELEATRGSVTVTATAYDAEDKKIVSNTMTFQVEKADLDERKDEGEEEGEIDLSAAEDILEKMKEEAVTAAGQTQNASKSCDAAKKKAELVKDQLKDLKRWLSSTEEAVDGLEDSFDDVKDVIEELRDDKKDFDKYGEKIAKLRDKAGEEALIVCEMAEAIVGAPTMDERKKAMRKAEKAHREVEEAKTDAERLFLDAKAYVKRIAQAKERLVQLKEAIQDTRKSVEGAENSKATTDQELQAAGKEQSAAQARVEQAQGTQGRSAELLDEGVDLLKDAESQEAKDLLAQMKDVMGGVKEVVENVQECPDETQKEISPVSDDFADFEEDVQELETDLSKVEKELADSDFDRLLQDLDEDVESGFYVMELFVEDIERRWNDAELCMELAEVNMDAPLIVTVPDLYGKDGGEVAEKLKKVHLTWTVVGGNPAPKKELEHTVEAQAPPAGSRVEAKSSVDLTFYGPYEEFAVVPNVMGLPIEKAKQTIIGAGLTVQAAEGDASSESSTRHTVYSQIPGAGSEVSKGSLVTLVYYGQMELVEVPSVSGLSEEAAGSVLAGVGLGMDASEGDEAPSEEKSKKVYSQSPAAGIPVPLGTSVSVKIYQKYVKKYRVPNFVGQKLQAASGVLSANQLRFVVHMDEDPPEPHLAGEVFRQTPGAGTEIVVEEAVVHLYVYKESQQEYFVVARMYFPKAPEARKKSDGTTEEVKISELLRRLNPGSMTLNPNDAPLILHVAGEGLSAYPITFFQGNQQVATPVSWNLYVAATESSPARNATFSGAFLMAVEAVVTDPSQLSAYGVSADLLGQTNQVFKYVQLFNEQGTFQGTEAHDGGNSALSGGPFEAGWSLQRREELLNLYIEIFEFLGCFIATAVYERSDAPELWELRDFRDRLLSRSVLGRKLIHKYYCVAPKYGRVLRRDPQLRALVRPALDALVTLSASVDKDDPLVQWLFHRSLRLVDFLWSDDQPTDTHTLLLSD